MGAACGGPKSDQSRGGASAAKDQDVVRIWGDKYSTETRAIIKAMKYCGVACEFNEIETNFGVVNDQQTTFKSILKDCDEISSAMSQGPESAAPA